jgi:hypothetical protein
VSEVTGELRAAAGLGSSPEATNDLLNSSASPESVPEDFELPEGTGAEPTPEEREVTPPEEPEYRDEFAEEAERKEEAAKTTTAFSVSVPLLFCTRQD